MVQPLPNPTGAPTTREPRPPLTLLPARDAERDALVRVLALDRLRDLHDDGVTTEYVGRMYGVPGEYLEALEEDLRRDRGPVAPPPGSLFA
jgi:hypothetical protein